jgi:hypothetical protein
LCVEGGSRTYDLGVMNATLLPTELPRRILIFNKFYFFAVRPIFYFPFPFQRLYLINIFLGKYNSFRNVRPCVFGSFPAFMFFKSFLQIISCSGIQRAIHTFYNIYKPHFKKLVGPPRIARGPAAYETAEVLLLHGPIFLDYLPRYFIL